MKCNVVFCDESSEVVRLRSRWIFVLRCFPQLIQAPS